MGTCYDGGVGIGCVRCYGVKTEVYYQGVGEVRTGGGHFALLCTYIIPVE